MASVPRVLAAAAAGSSGGSSKLFTPIKLRQIEIKNRIFMSPMCQYSAVDGVPNDWHLVNLGSRAAGGAGLVMAEATGVRPEGRISPADTGIWNQEQVQAWQRITSFLEQQGAVPAIQLAHAGRKASTAPPWEGDKDVMPEEGGWQPVAPSPLPFAPGGLVPRELSVQEVGEVVGAFADAAKRSLEAGFKVIELHFAHGYLAHSFLSPLSNQRGDQYGGSWENRCRFAREVVTAVRKVWPEALPLFVRLSCTDWAPEGTPAWDLPQSVQLAKALAPLGVDLVDCSSGGMLPTRPPKIGPGYQVPFAKAIREQAGVATGAVGLITEPQQAEAILQEGEADVIFVGRELLRNPHWPLKAAHELRADVAWPVQYERAKFR